VHSGKLILAILVIVIIVQLSYVPSYNVKFDQSQVLYLARDLAVKGDFPVHGILNSRRAYNPPFFVWLYLLPQILHCDPSLVLILPALVLHVVAIYLLYLLGLRYFNLKVGLAAAVLYAFSTRGLYFGHASWAQALLSPFYVLMTFFLYEWLLKGKAWYLTVLVPLAAWITGIHWGGALTLGVLFFIPFLFRPRFQGCQIVAGGLIALALWMPYLNFEKDRAFADIRAIIEGPLPSETPEVISPLSSIQRGPTRPDVGSPGKKSEFGQLKSRIRSKWPLGYQVLKEIFKKGLFACRGMMGALVVNFHWSPFKASALGSFKAQALYFIEVTFFMLGLTLLVHRKLIGKSATPEEYLLLLTFLVPALLQNLSSYDTVRRPDISWLFYGPQVLIVAYGFSRLPWVRLKGRQALVVMGLTLLIGVECHGTVTRLSSTWGGTLNYQRRMVNWIGEDVLSQGRKETAIRYDFLRDMPQWRWILGYSSLKDSYYVGTQHDYLLEHLYGIRNKGKAPDGWTDNPDYIVLFSKGLKRYEPDRGEYAEKDFGNYAVLKALK
jgi:4-amino-4-deoxy-L-arabinose transferase-like glycosyltransferase